MAVTRLRKPLSDRAKSFCRRYVENGYNGKKAYGEAYKNPNEDTSAVGAYQLLRDPRVQDEISFLEGTYKSLAYKVGLTKELVVHTLVEMMKATKKEKQTDGSFKEVPDWYARVQAITQYTKITGDFNEKNSDMSAEKELNRVDALDTKAISGLNREELEERRQQILEKIGKTL